MPTMNPAPARLVVLADEGLEVRAATLAERLGASVVAAPEEALDAPFVLRVACAGVHVDWREADRPAVRIGVDPHAVRGGADPVVRAVRGARPAEGLRVVDATAGLGKDALALARAGMHVTAIERDPLLAILLEDAVSRAAASREPIPYALAGRLHLVHADARTWLGQHLPRPDVVLLDPMYPRLRGGAKRRDAAFLRAWLGEPDDDAPREERALLARARRAASMRVVVKRPRKAPPLAPGVSGSLRGATTRFDVYAGTRGADSDDGGCAPPDGDMA